MINNLECGICYAGATELYCYGVVSLVKAQETWSGICACFRCQDSWIKRHTVICGDCGNTYITVNVGVAKRCVNCAQAYNSKVRSVSSEKIRAKDKGLSATMSREDWVVTLTHFDNSCAYCGAAYQVIEHFTPVVKGGGTDCGNCIPACARCNRIKGILDGRAEKEELSISLGVPVDKLIEIEHYLNNRTRVPN